MTNVLRIVALGGSICSILRGPEAPGGPTSNQPCVPGGSAKENKHSRIGGPRLGAWGGWLAEVWMFACLEKFGCWDVGMFGDLEVLEVWMFGCLEEF